jgi:hypothetical protein
MVLTVEMLEKVEIPLIASMAEYPPQIFAGSGSVSVFPCFYRDLLKEASGSPLYRVFFKGLTSLLAKESSKSEG